MLAGGVTCAGIAKAGGSGIVGGGVPPRCKLGTDGNVTSSSMIDEGGDGVGGAGRIPSGPIACLGPLYGILFPRGPNRCFTSG